MSHGGSSPLHAAVITLGYILTFGVVVAFTWILTPYIRIILEVAPRIVQETTRRSKTPLISDILEPIKKWFVPLANENEAEHEECKISIEDELKDLVLPKESKQCILDLAHAVCNARKNKTQFRHAILHGPEKMGKSIAAKKIARVAALDYAHVSGQSVFVNNNEESLSQIQTLFSWSKLSPKGMLLFIDDAEHFLCSNNSSLMNGASKRKGHTALSAFLYNLSKLPKDIYIVLGTNRYQDLDDEVLSHFEERIFLPLPDACCRKKLILLYFDLCITKFIEHRNAKNASSIKSRLIQFIKNRPPIVLSVEENIMSGNNMEDIVSATRGLSGDDIRDLMMAMQRALYDSSNDKTLDFATAWKLIEAKVKYIRDSQQLAGEHKLSYLDGDIDLQDVEFV